MGLLSKEDIIMQLSHRPVITFAVITLILTLLSHGAGALLEDQRFDLSLRLANLASFGIKVLLLGFISTLLPWPLKDRVAALFMLIYLIEVAPNMIEYYFFSSGTASAIVRMLGVGLVEAFIAAVAVARFYPPEVKTDGFSASLRRWFRGRNAGSWIWRLVAAALIYLTLYLVIGGIAFQFTQPYYTDPSYGLELKLPEGGLALIMRLQPLRTLIIIVGLSSLIAGLSLPGRTHGILVGLTFFVLGGLVPLLAGPENWPVALKIYHTVEVFFQNIPAGYLFTLLLAKSPAQPVS
jgi:hypothetical protein